jgi:hypothetical protein
VVETNDIVDGADFRVVQAPQSDLSFGGGNGRGNAFLVDGVANYFQFRRGTALDEPGSGARISGKSEQLQRRIWGRHEQRH